MNRGIVQSLLAALLLAAPLASGACSSGDASGKDQSSAPAAIAVATAAAVEQPIARFIRATGTLMAEEQADVAAETAGRVVSAPVERGTPVSPGAELVRLSATETDAQLKEAQARVSLARKALADTAVRAPFAGVVAERLASVGDYVTKGMKVATVVRVNPLRVRLTIPEQFVSVVAVGQPVTFEVDAYAGRQFEGRVKYVSPALQADQRALTVEAMVPNANAVLKPGLFATARIEQPAPTPGVLVPAAAVLTTSGTSRVYVVTGGRAEERIVTIGERVGDLLEITKGLKAGEHVATKNVGQLADGTKVESRN